MVARIIAEYFERKFEILVVAQIIFGHTFLVVVARHEFGFHKRLNIFAPIVEIVLKIMGELFLQRIQLIFGHLFVTFCCYNAAQDIECGFRLRIISEILLFQELQKVVVLLIRKRKSTGTSNGAMMILLVGAIVAQGIAR